jgi:hypothetical protein
MPTLYNSTQFSISCLVVLDSVLIYTNLYSTDLISAANTLPLYRSGTDLAENSTHTVAWLEVHRKHFRRIAAWNVLEHVYLAVA